MANQHRLVVALDARSDLIGMGGGCTWSLSGPYFELPQYSNELPKQRSLNLEFLEACAVGLKRAGFNVWIEEHTATVERIEV